MNSHVKRKDGKPNRGGGRFNRGARGGSGGRGGGSSRGKGRGSSKGKGGGGGGGGGSSHEGRKSGGSAVMLGSLGDAVLSAKEEREDYIASFCAPVQRRRTETKVSMQRLHMSCDNQEMVRDMLRDLHWGEDEEDDSGCGVGGIDDSEECDELDHRSDGQYWMGDTGLVVQEIVKHAPHRLVRERDGGDEGEEKERTDTAEMGSTNENNVSIVALNTLKRFGFDKGRCEAALLVTDGDVGRSLEQLLAAAGAAGGAANGSVNGCAQHDDVTWDEIMEQRVEESMTLASIYDDSFCERIPNHVWIVALDLPQLTALVSDFASSFKETKTVVEKAPVVMEKRPRRKNAPLCEFFRKGSCRYGDECRRRHGDVEATPRERYVPLYDDDGASSTLYQLEVRFPAHHRYPYEVPLVAFSSTNPDMPAHVCLNISLALLREARELVADAVPVVFSLIALLGDEGRLAEVLREPAPLFSLPLPATPKVAARPADVRPEPSKATRTKNNGSSTTKAVGRPSDNGQARRTPAAAVTANGTASQSAAAQPEGSKPISRPEPPRQRKRDYAQTAASEKLDARLVDRFLQQQESKAYMNMMVQRKKLPAWNKQGAILAALRSHQVLVISGMTGCGKTTQIPQFILDSYLNGFVGGAPGGSRLCNIICTQPRRISAIAVAERVAEERVDQLGCIVGYQIRLEKAMSASTRLLFCSTGILLRRLEGDHTLEGVTHVILDEVHERSEESDFLMMILRDLLPKRPDLKVILMSATLNADLFSEYFGKCPAIDIPGKTFPVQQFYLEDAIEYTRYVLEERSPYAKPMKKGSSRQGARKDCGYDDLEDDLSVRMTGTVAAKNNVPDQNLTVEQMYKRYEDYDKRTKRALFLLDHEKINNDLIELVIEWIVDGDHEFPKGGAILVFLPGIGEIMTLFTQLQGNAKIGGGRNQNKLLLIPLHSSLTSEEQHAVFSKPKKDVTKIVLATNIAETSITIEDVVYVIDSGRMKEKRYDPSKGMESLDLTWVARANAIQRRGRAGRVAAGVCFHLYTSHRYQYQLRDQPIPEIQRIPLEQMVLNIRMLELFKGQEVAAVLAKIIEAPETVNIDCAMSRLEALGAIDSDHELTPLGYHLGSLPVDVRIGKLMLFGAIFCCLDAALTIAAILSFKSPFVAPFERRDEADAKRMEFAVANSDHLTVLKAYQGWMNCKKNMGNHSQYAYCRENFLSVKTLEMLASMKRQFTELLSDIGFVASGLTVRKLDRLARGGSDGVIEATGVEANCNNDNLKLVSAILVAALYPNVVQVLTPESKFSQSGAGAVPRAPNADELRFKTKMDGYVNIHPSSVNFQTRHYDSPYLVYHEKMKTSKVYIRDSTMVSVYPLLLFAGDSIAIEVNRGSTVMSVDDGWIRFLVASRQVAELVRELRREFDQLLEDKIETPKLDLCSCPRGSRIIATIVQLVTTQ